MCDALCLAAPARGNELIAMIEKSRYKPDQTVYVETFANYDGRGERIRTSDLVDPNDARYRAAPLPDIL